MITSERFTANGGTGKYDQKPASLLPDGFSVLGTDEFWKDLRDRADAKGDGQVPVVIFDTYPGVELDELEALIRRGLPGWDVTDVEAAAKSDAEIQSMLDPFLTSDRVFGHMNDLEVSDFYDQAAFEKLCEDATVAGKPVALYGWGAAMFAKKCPRASLVLVDLARWEIQQRYRAGMTNWHTDNSDEDILRKYKRGFFIEWRSADRHKESLFADWDFVVDGNRIKPSDGKSSEIAALTGDGFRAGMASLTTHPFRVVPFFDPGVWGGEWMESLVGLERKGDKYAWCFDCVPEENSLLLTDGKRSIELPAMDLTLSEPRRLLGERVFEQFGAEFPIRFDFLDTMGGGNLSLQVHPLREYIKEQFGMPYTQDESYYILDAEPGAVVYLGLNEDVDPEAMIADLNEAQEGEVSFDAEKYVGKYPAKKHDHFAIPAGTVHCSGMDSMVLEISATPYIFTFKMWDWDRLGLDGRPRPIHLEHGAKNIQWDRDAQWVADNLIDQVETVTETADYVEERTGLHELESTEVRRHWFTGPVEHDTRDTVNVLNLVEGDEVVITSPTGAFEPMVIHYAETFIVPAAVGKYVISPTADSVSKSFATLKAYVRGTQQV